MRMIALAAGTPLNLSPIIYAIVGFCALIGLLMGLWRGFMRQMVRSVTVIISAIASYVLVSVGYTYLIKFLDTKEIWDIEYMIRKIPLIPADFDLSFLYNFDVETVETALVLPAALIIMPILFVAVFITVSSVLMILYKLICFLCGFKSYHNTGLTRLTGMLLGLVQGVVVAGLLLMPAVGISALADDGVRMLNEQAAGDPATEKCTYGYDTYVKSVRENKLIKLYEKFGIDSIYGEIATVDFNGERLDTRELLPEAVSITADVLKLRGADIKYLTPEQETLINSILDKVEANPYFSNLVSCGVRTLATAYGNGVFSLPVKAPFDTIVVSAVELFETCDETTLHEDLDTLSDVFFILVHDRVFASFDYGAEETLKVLTAKDAEGNTTISRIVVIIKSNERTKALVTLVSRLSVTVMAEKAGITEESVETYENIKDSLNSDVLSIDKESYGTKEEYVADVSTALDTTLKNNNIELEKDIVDTMAEYIADNYSDTSELTDEMASDIIISYYDAYLKYTETGAVPAP